LKVLSVGHLIIKRDNTGICHYLILNFMTGYYISMAREHLKGTNESRLQSIICYHRVTDYSIAF
jgi:hypothetical protein